MRLFLSTRGMYPRSSGGSVAFYLRLANHLVAENIECHTGLMNYNADWFAERLPERIKKHRLLAADAREAAQEEARYAEKIASDWMLFLFPHAYDAYETTPDVRKACIVHDLQHLHFPEFFPASHRWERDLALSRATQYADWLFTISEFTRDDLITLLSGRRAQDDCHLLRGRSSSKSASSDSRILHPLSGKFLASQES